MPDPQNNSIPMIGQAPGGAYQTKMVPPDQAKDAQQAGWTNAYKMVGQQGTPKWVPEAQVSDARMQNFAITPDSPGAVPMLKMDGSQMYAMPSEVQPFEQNRTAVQINPDGTLPSRPGESGAAARNRHDIWFQAGQGAAVRQALAVSDRAQNVAGNTMAGAAAAGLGAESLGALTAPTTAAVPGGIGFGGAAAGEAAGPSVLGAGARALAGRIAPALGGAGAAGAGYALFQLIREALEGKYLGGK